MADQLISSSSRHNSRAVHVVPSRERTKPSSDTPMVWRGSYEPGDCFVPGDVVTDDGWLLTPNRPTCDKPAPVPIGDAYWIYDGLTGWVYVPAKRITFGQEFTSPTPKYLTGWRVKTVLGYQYDAYIVNGGIITQLLSWEAQITDWAEFDIGDVLVPANTTFQLLVQTRQPDPTPVTWVGNWDYDTPNNPGTPLSGVASHANQLPSSLRIHKTDNDGGDREAELLALTAGDTIDALGTSWAISAVTDRGTYVEFTVAPTTQEAPDGVTAFTFTTETESSITIDVDVNHWQDVDNISGLYSINGADPVVTDDAYGVDVKVQDVSYSDAWDVMAWPNNGVAGSSGGGDLKDYIALEASTQNLDDSVARVIGWDKNNPFDQSLDNSFSVGWYGVRVTKAGLYAIDAGLGVEQGTFNEFRFNTELITGHHIDTWDATGAIMHARDRRYFTASTSSPGLTGRVNMHLWLESGDTIGVRGYVNWGGTKAVMTQTAQSFLRVTRLS